MEKMKLLLPKYNVYIFLVCTFIFFIVVYLQPIVLLKQGIILINEPNTTNKDYLVFSSKCMIPNLDPWNDEIRTFYKKQQYIQCSKYDLLTYVVKNNTNAVLYFDKEAARNYTSKPIKCCYMDVTRNSKVEVPDDNIVISKCVDFRNELDITGRVVTVKCRSKYEIYSNTHAPVTISEPIRNKMEAHINFMESKTTGGPLSVLLVGIDSISRLNFIRTMPRTRDFLTDSDWIEYTGHNKIGDNTFPNVMAILTGKNMSVASQVCNPAEIGKLDNCNFIWKDYGNFGYITAFAEDEFRLNTFNYKKKGFIEEPTDYYFRTYLFAANKLNKKKVDDMDYCTGPEISGERILNVAKDFSNTFKKYPNFGFFWMNSFSHNELNSPTRMDDKVLEFFKDLLNVGILEDSIIIFMSDHGLRFGEVRLTRTGWLEERLPFLYFWIPKWFRYKYHKEYLNFKTNANNHLTTPYDLYMTLQDLLRLSGFSYTVKPSEGCPLSKSLFSEIPSRSCEEAGIDIHWCTCYGYSSISRNDNLAKEASQFIVEQINNMVFSYGEQSKNCAKYNTSKIIAVNMSMKTLNTNNIYLLVIVETTPKAVFESTVIVVNENFEKGSYISRLDSYNSHSDCVEDSRLKLYCYCK